MIVDIHTHSLPAGGAKSRAVYNIDVYAGENISAAGYEGLLSVGIHPWYAAHFSALLIDKMTQWIDGKGAAAIGECGLDKNRGGSLNAQIKVFEKQIELSEQKKKPVIIHCVGRFNELFELRSIWKPQQPWIIHGFRGKPQLAGQALKSGCSLSFGELFNAESMRVVPLENLFLETDESKVPIEEIYKRAAEVKQCRVEELNAGERLLQTFS